MLVALFVGFPVFSAKHHTWYPMHFARLVLSAAPLVLLTASVFAQYSSAPTGPGVDQLCRDCGVIYDIRQIASEREFANALGDTPFQDERSPPARSMITIPFTNKPEANVPRFDVYGSRSMRKQLEERTYEVVIRYDDGRYARMDVSDVGQLYVGARVRIRQNRIELYYRE